MLIRINPFVRHNFIHDLAFVKFSNFISIHSLPHILCNASVIVFSFLTVLFLLSGLLLMLTSVSGGFLFTPPTICQFQFQLILFCPCGASLVCTSSWLQWEMMTLIHVPVVSCAYFYHCLSLLLFFLIIIFSNYVFVQMIGVLKQKRSFIITLCNLGTT